MLQRSALTVAYHGCDRSVGEDAISGTHLLHSTNDYDWLGHGVYFWENDPVRAKEWAASQPDVTDPFVVGAVIDLGRCLDLIEVDHLELLCDAYAGMREVFEAAGQDLPINEHGFKGDADLVKRHLDCAVINYLHEMREQEGADPFDTVRSPFAEGKPLYPGGKIMARTHVQICVCNRDNILGYFLPLC